MADSMGIYPPQGSGLRTRDSGTPYPNFISPHNIGTKDHTLKQTTRLRRGDLQTLQKIMFYHNHILHGFLFFKLIFKISIYFSLHLYYT